MNIGARQNNTQSKSLLTQEQQSTDQGLPHKRPSLTADYGSSSEKRDALGLELVKFLLQAF